MTGEWTKRRSSEHTCDKPKETKGAAAGDEWTCGFCRRVWRVKQIVGPDQREPDITPFFIWEQVT